MTVVHPPLLPGGRTPPYFSGMNFTTQKGTGLWPLMVVLAVWTVLMAQAVGIWLQPHQPAAALAQCAQLQGALARAPGISH